MTVYFCSPIDAKSPLLFDTFEKTFLEQGHSITTNINEATAFMFDMHSGYLPYDKEVLKVVLDKKLPVIVLEFFDHHCDSSKHWFGLNNWKGLEELIYQHDWANFLWLAKDKCKLVYFMRKMQTNCDYGEFVYPLELIQFPDHDFPMVTKEELCNREFDAVFIGAKSPRREAFINSLQKDGRLKLDIQWTEERIPHNEWLDRHRQGKFFIEADGGGIGSERPYQLITILPMLKQHNSQLIVNDFYCGLDCIKIGGHNFTVANFCKLLQYPGQIYSIYQKGIEKMKTYFNAEYRAKYLLAILKQNNIN